MSQIRLYITRNKAEAEEIFNLLEPIFEEDGTPIAITEIDEDKQIFEVSLYSENATVATDLQSRMALGLGIPETEISREVLPDIDWVLHSLAGLKPVHAGRFFVHGSHDADKCNPDDIPIIIEAGLAFGTGHHGTTAGCLEMIEKIMASEQPSNALDLGTGSAVLAIAIAKLQSIPIIATDNDPIAVEVAQENIELNNTDSTVTTAVAEGFDHPLIKQADGFDLIVANILAQPLIELAPQMRNHINDDGSIILSGILATQRDRVLEAYSAAGFNHVETNAKDVWVTLHLKP